MKAICNSCKFQVSGSDKEELEKNYRAHTETFGHAGFCIIDYDQNPTGLMMSSLTENPSRIAGVLNQQNIKQNNQLEHDEPK